MANSIPGSLSFQRLVLTGGEGREKIVKIPETQAANYGMASA